VIPLVSCYKHIKRVHSIILGNLNLKLNNPIVAGLLLGGFVSLFGLYSLYKGQNTKDSICGFEGCLWTIVERSIDQEPPFWSLHDKYLTL
jgi:hypothetical protein